MTSEVDKNRALPMNVHIIYLHNKQLDFTVVIRYIVT